MNGKIDPHKIQNLVIREACRLNSYKFHLSSVEYVMDNSYMVLNNLIKNSEKYDGIVFFSLFQLPENQKEREKIYKKILSKKKIIFFASEKIEITNKRDIYLCENIIKISNMLKYCPKKINSKTVN